VHTQTQDGTVTISGAGLVYTVTVNLSAGTTFSTVSTPALQICASTAAFTSKVAGNANCTGTADGVFDSYSVTGSSATESVTLPSAFNNLNAYFEVLSDTNDSGVENTSAACPISATPLYGSCSVPFVAVSTPSGGVIGIISAAALAAGGLTYVTFRRRRRSQRVA
jgi:lysozyme family protein